MSTSSMELVRTPGSREVTPADFQPLFTVEAALARKKQINAILAGVLEEGSDYGKIPGTNDKKVLLKAGAEKLSSLFGLAPRFLPVQTIEDWTGAEHGGEPLFYYEYRCELSRGDRFAGEGIGSANSWESRYRYRWVNEAQARQRADFESLPKRTSTVTEFDFAIDKGETGGQYGKPAEYWAKWKAAIVSGEAIRVKKATKSGKELDAWEMGGGVYRIPNDQFGDIVNTIQKMAQKRALVAAVLVVTNCSDAFTQDLEDSVELEEAPAQQKPRGDRASYEKAVAAAAAKPPEMTPEHPWTTFGGMVNSFAALKQRLAPYQTPYYERLRKYGCAHAADFAPERLTELLGTPISAKEAAQRAADCYRELLAVVKDYEALKDAPAQTAFDVHMAGEEEAC